jgi:hypothetical protein
MKICILGTELFRADRQTDMMKLIVAFRSFAKSYKKSTFWQQGRGNVAISSCVKHNALWMLSHIDS